MTQPSFAATRFRVRSVIGRSASMLWRRFPSFFVVGLIASLPVLLIVKAQTTEPAGPGDLSRPLREMLGFVLLMVFNTFGQAVVANATFQDMRRGGQGGLVESLNAGLRRFWSLLGLALVGLMTLLGFTLVVPGLILSTIWFVALPACIVRAARDLDEFAPEPGIDQGSSLESLRVDAPTPCPRHCQPAGSILARRKPHRESRH
jgi:hypothetical protein